MAAGNVPASDLDANFEALQAQMGNPLTVAVIGSSFSAANTLLENPWPEITAEVLGNLAVPVTLFNLSIDAQSYYRANTNIVSNGMTAVNACIAANPQLVIVALGYNDTITNVDGRTVAQCEADALAFYTALAAGLPNARSEERRVGKECWHVCRSRWSPYH